MPVPAFDQYVEYVTEGPIIHPVALAQHSLDSLLTLEVVQGGYAHAAGLGRAPALDGPALVAVQAVAGEVYQADVVAHEVTGSDPVVVVDRLLWVRDHPAWRVGLDVTAGTVYFDAGTLWRCVQSHCTQSGWRPATTPALWARYYTPGTTPAWVQPVGASDAWPLGARVTHAGHLWTSLVRDNVWEPGGVGAEALWRCDDCVPTPGVWEFPHHYTGDNTAGAGNGDVVIDPFNNHLYRCLQTHDSISVWAPHLVASLWLDLGPA